MAEIYLRKTLTGWEPNDDEARRYHKVLKVGQVARATLKIPRYGPHHRLVFALLSLTYKNLPEKYEGLWRSFDHFRKAIALEAGHVEVIHRRDGEIVEVPGSLSFDSLGQPEFERVSAAMLRVCALILDMSEPELAQEVWKHADVERAA